MDLTDYVLMAVERERSGQNNKWGKQRHGYGKWLQILGEEFGEVCEAMLQNDVCAKGSDADDLYDELIQVAAVAVAIAEQVEEGRRGTDGRNRAE